MKNPYWPLGRPRPPMSVPDPAEGWAIPTTKPSRFRAFVTALVGLLAGCGGAIAPEPIEELSAPCEVEASGVWARAELLDPSADVSATLCVLFAGDAERTCYDVPVERQTASLAVRCDPAPAPGTIVSPVFELASIGGIVTFKIGGR